MIKLPFAFGLVNRCFHGIFMDMNGRFQATAIYRFQYFRVSLNSQKELSRKMYQD
jgi:hypothetical protein